jgi:hypothetical protein
MRMRFVAGILALGSVGGCTASTDLPPDELDPVVQITAPLDQATVNGGVSVDVSAADNYSVEIVRIFIDGVLKQTFYTQPYHYSWSTLTLQNNTTHTIDAEAVDGANNVGRATRVTVTVFNIPNAPQ